MAGGLHRDGDDYDEDEQNEINITPLIDVMLVLLIIFMVAAPLSTVDVPVSLPAASAKPSPRPDDPTFVTLKADFTLAVGNLEVARESLASALHNATNRNFETRLFLRVDKSVDYGDLLPILDLIRNAGYLKVGLVALEAGPSSQAPAAR